MSANPLIEQSPSSPSRRIAKRISTACWTCLREVGRSLQSTWHFAHRVALYGIGHLHRSKICRAVRQADQDLGERVYCKGTSGSPLIWKISLLDEQIRQAGPDKRISVSLRTQRADLIRQLGTETRTTTAPVAGIETEVCRAKEAWESFEANETKLKGRRSDLLPGDRREWQRVVVGVFVVILVICSGLYSLSSSTRSAKSPLSLRGETAEKNNQGRSRDQSDSSSVAGAMGIGSFGEIPVALPKSADGEQLLSVLFGSFSNKYEEHGFKNVTLGVTMDDLTKQIPLTGVHRRYRYIYLSGPDNNEQFVFDRDKRLVIYAKIYDGGADDHLDRIVEIFGKTDPAHIRSYTIETDLETTVRTVATYHCPKVLVQVTFSKSATALGKQEKTSVVVVSKAWGLPLLVRNLQDKRNNVEWLKQVAALTRNANPQPDLFPLLPDAEFRVSDIRARGDSLRVSVLDTKYKALNEKRVRDKLPGGFATIERPQNLRGKPTTKIYFNFGFYSANAIEAIYKQPEPRVYDSVSNNALGFTSFSEVIPELNALVLQEAFPPKTDTIKIVRPAKGTAYHEWRTQDGWKVTSRHNDSVTLERVETDGP